ncbi:MAG: oxidoreductase-like domain-containing protein [Betaproteobacteria bacterium]|jgi:hypothetical protein
MRTQQQLIFQSLQTADQAREVIELMGDLAMKCGVKLPKLPPPEPLGCCARGCQGCVWEGFVSATEYWRDCSLSVLQHHASDLLSHHLEEVQVKLCLKGR